MYCFVLMHALSCPSLRLFEMQPTRLLCPWDFSGNNTGLGCHFLLWGILLTQGKPMSPESSALQAVSLSLSHQHFHENFFKLKNDSVRGNQWKVMVEIITIYKYLLPIPALLATNLSMSFDLTNECFRTNMWISSFSFVMTCNAVSRLRLFLQAGSQMCSK